MQTVIKNSGGKCFNSLFQKVSPLQIELIIIGLSYIFGITFRVVGNFSEKKYNYDNEFFYVLGSVKFLDNWLN